MKPPTQVLLADDDAAVRESLCKVLKDAGYDVVLAKDGQEVLDLFDPGRTHLLILDLGLPVRDGWDAFERITSHAPVLPIIVITGRANQYHVAVAAGVGALLEKPLDAPLLLQTIRELISESKETRLRRLCGYDQELRYVPATTASLIRALREHFPSPPRQRLTNQAPGLRS